MKLNPIVMNVKGKRIILVDDSIVRGTTSGIIIRLLRNAGAKEIKCASVRLLSDSLVSSALIRHSGGSWSPRVHSEESNLTNGLALDKLHYLSQKGLGGIHFPHTGQRYVFCLL